MKKSHRSLGGMVVKAKAGEWMGGPPKLGFDVGCFDRATGKELWRVVFEGREKTGTTMRRGKKRPVYRILRRKDYPDGRTERLDGSVTFRTSKDTQVMRIVPTRDEAKLAAAKGVFERYATETVSFFDLAKWLNSLGICNSFGNAFQSNDIRKMLSDEAYLGYPTFSKRRSGRFHRVQEGGITELEPGLKGKDTASDPANVIISSVRHYEPLVERPIWDAVQRKLRGRSKLNHAPKYPGLYLAGIVVCAGCGKPMVARADRMEYYCGTWDKHRTRGTLKECPCERNGVKQAVLEEYIDRYLEETGKRLELLTRKPDADHLTEHLEKQETEAWSSFRAGIDRLCGYLMTYHPEEYAAILQEDARRAAEDRAVMEAAFKQPASPIEPGTLKGRYGKQFEQACDKLVEDVRQGVVPTAGQDNEFVGALLECYRANFDPKALKADIKRLEAEHDKLMAQWADLPTPRSREKAKERFTELEARIDELKAQQQDAAAVVELHYQQMLDLQTAVAEAQAAMQSETGAQALRRRAESIRGLLCRIECEFVLTGKKTAGPGNARSKLVALHFLPIAGDGIMLPVDDLTSTACEAGETNGRERLYGKP
jgi:hypothetical protein